MPVETKRSLRYAGFRLNSDFVDRDCRPLWRCLRLLIVVSAFAADGGEHTCAGYADGRSMFRIKICGVRNEADIDAVAEAGADAIGLNFHPPSIRYVELQQAIGLSVCAAERSLTRVGVFVEHGVEEIAEIASATQLDVVQLHGRQSFEDARWLKERGFAVLRVVRLIAGPLDPNAISAAVEAWKWGEFPLLLDAEAGDHGGGLGLRLDWKSIGTWSKNETFSKSILPTQVAAKIHWGLAGGLTPASVGEAITDSHAMAIDVASGVEEPRGKKSRLKISSFVTAALAAWEPDGDTNGS